MPRNDGTGPMGRGAMSGRGMGSCIEFVTAGDVNQGPGRGMGCGHRRMRGSGGRGMGWKQKCVKNTFLEDGLSVSNKSPFGQQNELDLIKNKTKKLGTILEEINKRLSELNT